MAQIVLPMAALALWTLIVLSLVPVARIRAARAGRVHVKDFRYGESPNVPGDVSLLGSYLTVELTGTTGSTFTGSVVRERAQLPMAG